MLHLEVKPDSQLAIRLRVKAREFWEEEGRVFCTKDGVLFSWPKGDYDGYILMNRTVENEVGR